MSMWIPALPSGWQQARLKTRLRRNDGGAWGEDSDGSDESIVLRSTEQYVDGTWNIEEPARRKLTEREASTTRLEEGDLLITKSSGSEHHIGKTSLVTAEVASLRAGFSNFMQRLTVDARTCPRYVHYWLNNSLCREQFAYLSNSTSGLANLTASLIGEALLAFPPLKEQERIANFLDEKTARIDALIAEKERLVANVNEFRASRIRELVLRGVSDAPLRGTHVDWIAEIPRHWDVVRIKHVARLESGHTPDKQVHAYWEGCAIPWVSLNDTAMLKDVDYIDVTAACVNELGIANSSARLLPEGTVFFSRDATIGRCGIARRPMACSQHFIGWVCGESIIPEFLLFALRSMTSELERLTMGATLKTIGMDDVKQMSTPLPPAAEQREIVAQILKAKEASNEMLRQVTDFIGRLREYRSSLISAAVTGQLDFNTYKVST